MPDLKLKKITRVGPAVWQGHSTMYKEETGGYVAYTDYCININRLRRRVAELEGTIISLAAKGAVIS